MLLFSLLCAAVIPHSTIIDRFIGDGSKVEAYWEKFNGFSEYPLNSTFYDKAKNQVASIESGLHVRIDFKNIVLQHNGHRQGKSIFIHRFYLVEKKGNRVVYISPWSISAPGNTYIIEYDHVSKTIDVTWGDLLISTFHEDDLKSEQRPDLRNQLSK